VIRHVDVDEQVVVVVVDGVAMMIEYGASGLGVSLCSHHSSRSWISCLREE